MALADFYYCVNVGTTYCNIDGKIICLRSSENTPADKSNKSHIRTSNRESSHASLNWNNKLVTTAEKAARMEMWFCCGVFAAISKGGLGVIFGMGFFFCLISGVFVSLSVLDAVWRNRVDMIGVTSIGSGVSRIHGNLESRLRNKISGKNYNLKTGCHNLFGGRLPFWLNLRKESFRCHFDNKTNEKVGDH